MESEPPSFAGIVEQSPVETVEEPINILIVDDEPKNLTVLESLLNDPSYRLVRAQSADQALLALVEEEFALLILDIRMPGMNGLGLAQMIKERKRTSQVPIIFLTAYFNEDQHVLEGYESGAVDYLHKPVNAAILRSKVAVFAELFCKNRELLASNRALQAGICERRLVEERLNEANATLELRVAARTESLHEMDRRKDEFLATLAHELRNPLAPVRNAVQLLHMKAGAIPELQWITDVIGRQTQVMARLLDDLMDVSRISRGRIELKRDRVELTRIIQTAIESSQPIIDECGHDLTVSLPPEAVIVNADVTRLTQVILNLLNNAAKYTERGGQIELRADRQGQELVVSVRDSGIGIPRDRLHTIFEMFSQVEKAISRSQGGLGIGLCLAKRLVEMHGGEISVHSEGEGRGSEFIIRLPIVTGQVEPAESADAGTGANLGSTLRILAVDDNQDAISTLTVLLKMMGNTVRTACDGEEALEVASVFLPDVVLLDIGLPKKNGYEVARSIRQEFWGKSMILIAVTGWGQAEDRQTASEAGFDLHMVKPVDPQTLMELLADLQIMRPGNGESE